MPLTRKPLFYRRFIRLKAIQNLYAFYIAKQATYAWATDQLNAAFLPDLFAHPPQDKAQLALDAEQALAVFKCCVETSQDPDDHLPGNSFEVIQVVEQAMQHYNVESNKDLQKLKEGLETAIGAIERACLYTVQLLVEWGQLAERQAKRPRMREDPNAALLSALGQMRPLQQLCTDPAWSQLVQQKAAGWEDHQHLTESWYYQYVKKDPKVLDYLKPPVSSQQAQQLLTYLVEGIILNNEETQEFFSDLDLGWTAHKPFVKKMVRSVFAMLEQYLEKGGNLGEQLAAITCGEDRSFYTKLVMTAVEQDEAFEELIAKRTRNWAVNRLVLLDKTIIKLALCEMMYFKDIPIKASINEYIELAKAYSAPKSSQFVNGLLDAVADTLTSAK